MIKDLIFCGIFYFINVQRSLGIISCMLKISKIFKKFLMVQSTNQRFYIYRLYTIALQIETEP